MAIAYVNKGTLDWTGQVTNCTPPLPASIVAGNLLVACVYTITNGASAHTWPAGWTLINAQVNAGGQRGSFAYRIATGTDTAPNVTWTASTSISTSQIFQFSGTTATPIGNASANFGTAATHTSGSVTTSLDESVVIYLDLSAGVTAFTIPSGWTSDSSATDAGSKSTVSIGHKTIATSGSGSGAISTAGGATAWVQWQQEFYAAAVPSSGTSDQNRTQITASSTGITNTLGASTQDRTQITATGNAYSGNSSDAVMSLITASGTALTDQTGLSAQNLTIISASGTAEGGGLGTVAVSVLPITIVAEGHIGGGVQGSVTLPALTIAAGADTGPIRAIPAITLAAAAVGGVVTNSFQRTLIVPYITVVAAGTGGSSAAADIVAPKTRILATANPGSITSGLQAAIAIPRIAIASQVSALVTGNVTLSRIILAASGYTGVLATAGITIPVILSEGVGYEPPIGSASLAVPLIVLQATARQVDISSQFTISMHTERQALTTYTNYPFNSFAKFNGVYLGASGTGLFALTGATDDGVLIDAVARVGATDFNTSKLKRINYMYIGYRTDGELVLKVITDEVNVREYLVAPTGKTGLHVNRVVIGKGVSARYWQFEIANRGGADFDLNVMELKPTVLTRRIGGNA